MTSYKGPKNKAAPPPYADVLAAALATNGQIAKTGEFRGEPEHDRYSSFGIAMDYRATEHKEDCGVAVMGEVTEADTHYFKGTFTEQGWTYYMRAKVSCKCGRLKDRWLVLQGTMSDLLALVIKVSYSDLSKAYRPPRDALCGARHPKVDSEAGLDDFDGQVTCIRIKEHTGPHHARSLADWESKGDA